MVGCASVRKYESLLPKEQVGITEWRNKYAMMIYDKYGIEADILQQNKYIALHLFVENSSNQSLEVNPINIILWDKFDFELSLLTADQMVQYLYGERIYEDSELPHSTAEAIAGSVVKGIEEGARKANIQAIYQNAFQYEEISSGIKTK